MSSTGGPACIGYSGRFVGRGSVPGVVGKFTPTAAFFAEASQAKEGRPSTSGGQIALWFGEFTPTAKSAALQFARGS